MNCKILPLFYALVASTLLGLWGCPRSDSDQADVNIVRVGETVMTMADFSQILETAEMGFAYLEEDETEKEGRGNYHLNLLNQATEEVILREHARHLGIGVSETELARAIEAVKADYPDEAFEQVLLESAVSFKIWRSRMKHRLLMDKVIAQELEDRMEITPEEIAAYYADHYRDQGQTERPGGKAPGEEHSKETPDPEEERRINEKIIKHLRRDKAEKAYGAWIEELSQRYPVEINWEQWRKLVEP
jgi:hypothetical protein